MTHAPSLAALSILLATLGSCGKEESPKVSLSASPAAGAASTTAAAPSAPIQVETILAERQEVSAPVAATGQSQPIRKADLAPAMNARIDKIYVREGQAVKAGQLLVALDGRTAQLSAEQARASAMASAASADQLDADYQRLAPLAERGSVAKSRLEQLDSQRKAARASARAAQSAAGAASRAATNALLRAPFAGTIVDLPHEVGEMASGASLARLVDLSQLEIHVRVAAGDLSRLAVGDAVTASFPQLGSKATGKVASIGLEIDPATSTAEVVAVVPNPDGALRAGLYTELSIAPAQKRTALVVPRSAIAGTSGGAASVLAVEDNRAIRKPVETQPFDEDRVEITRDLGERTVLVARGLGRVPEGSRVVATPQISKAEAEAEPKADSHNQKKVAP